MKVRIAFATKPDGNGGWTVDTDRVDSIEDHPDADAKELIKQGIAAVATDRDVSDWESSQARRKLIAEAEAATPVVTEADLQSLTMDELREQYDAAAELPTNARKAELVAAIEASERSRFRATGGVISGSGEPGDDTVPVALGSHPTIVTVAPDAESSPDVDPADRD